MPIPKSGLAPNADALKAGRAVQAIHEAGAAPLTDKLLYLWYLLPRALRNRLRHRIIAQLPSRTYMQRILVPALAAVGCRRMLFVGVQSYNVAIYRACDAAGIAVWSIDSDPKSSRFGAPRGHFTVDIRHAPRVTEGLTFDVVVYNGILGYGINTAADAAVALAAMAKVAEPGAILVVGWAPGLTDDAEIAIMRRELVAIFLPGAPADIVFPARPPIHRHPHRYEIFRFADPVMTPAS